MSRERDIDVLVVIAKILSENLFVNGFLDGASFQGKNGILYFLPICQMFCAEKESLDISMLFKPLFRISLLS